MLYQTGDGWSGQGSEQWPFRLLAFVI